MNDGMIHKLYVYSRHAMGVFLFLLFMGIEGGEEMNQKRTEEEIKEYNRKIEEVFRKHGLKLKTVYGHGAKAIIPGSKPKEDCNKKQKDDK